MCVVRSPSASDSDSVRYVGSDGTLDDSYACIGDSGVRPASVEFTATK